MMMKRGKLRAHTFFRYAHLVKFGRGVEGTCRPYVDLLTSTLDRFCDKSKDFLKLSRLLSKFHLVDHLKNAHECLNCVHAMHATYDGTYGNKNSGPHLNALLDPKSLMLIETRALHLALRLSLNTWHTQSLYGMSLRLMISLVLGQHSTRLQTPRDFWFISLVFLFIYHRRMSIYSLPKHTINDDGCSKVYSNCINMLLKNSKFKYRSWGRILIFPLYLTQTSLLQQEDIGFYNAHWLMPCPSQCSWFFKTIIFKISKYVHPWWSCTQLVFSVVWVLALPRM